MDFFYHSTSIGFVDLPNTTTLNIYSVGCEHNCKNCHCPDLQDINHKDRIKLTKKKLDFLLKTSNGFIQSICWLGGDPLFQLDGCLKLINYAKQKYPNIKHTVFTGYTFEQFDDNQKQMINRYVYILIDGKYNGYVLGDPKCNQKVYIFDNKQLNYTNIQYSQLNSIFNKVA